MTCDKCRLQIPDSAGTKGKDHRRCGGSENAPIRPKRAKLPSNERGT